MNYWVFHDQQLEDVLREHLARVQLQECMTQGQRLFAHDAVMDFLYSPECRARDMLRGGSDPE